METKEAYRVLNVNVSVNAIINVFYIHVFLFLLGREYRGRGRGIPPSFVSIQNENCESAAAVWNFFYLTKKILFDQHSYTAKTSRQMSPFNCCSS